MSAATSNPLLLPLSNILLAGTGASRTVQLTPAAGINGQATVTLTASDGHLGSSFLFVVTVTPDTPWTNWAQAKFAGNWGNASISGPTAVPDGDSIQNLMEYGLAGNPLAGATFILPRITHGASGVEFRFPRNTAATDLRISVESAASLPGVWSEIAVSTSGNPLTRHHRRRPSGRIQRHTPRRDSHRQPHSGSDQRLMWDMTLAGAGS